MPRWLNSQNSTARWLAWTRSTVANGRRRPSTRYGIISRQDQRRADVRGRQDRLDGNASALAAAAIATANKYEAAGTKFLESHILKHIVSGRIYAEIHPFLSDEGGTRSTRFSYSNPPLQQMPVRDKELGPLIRRVFLPEAGEFWCKPDQAAGISLAGGLRRPNTTCPVREKPSEAYRDNPDADFHAVVAEMTGLERDAAKTVNFAKIYGAGAKKFAEMIGKPVAEAQAIITQYDRKLPFVAKLSLVTQETAIRTATPNSMRRPPALALMGSGVDLRQGAGPCDIEESTPHRDPVARLVSGGCSGDKVYTALNAHDFGLGRTAYQALDARGLARRHRPDAADA